MTSLSMLVFYFWRERGEPRTRCRKWQQGENND
jgi:hypothetical protein